MTPYLLSDIGCCREPKARQFIGPRSDMAEPGGRLGRLTGWLDSDAAAWVPAALRGFAEGVCSIVPPVFDAYARVFHPATRMEDKEEVPVRWADVAEANGRTVHPAAEWGSIVAGLLAHKQSGQPGLWDQPPSQGELPQGIARRLLVTLSEHTAQPDHAFFAVWEGFGYPPRSSSCSRRVCRSRSGVARNKRHKTPWTRRCGPGENWSTARRLSKSPGGECICSPARSRRSRTFTSSTTAG